MRTTSYRNFWKVVMICFLFFAELSWAAEASSPLAVIQSGTDRALEILRSAQTGRAPTIRERRAEILVIVDDYFNFEEMGKRALGRPWKDQSPDKQQEFVRLFKQLLFDTYVDRVETYTAADEQVVYDEQQVEGPYAFVKTRVLNYKNTDVDVNYRLRQEDGKWRVYDVIVEGVSLVSNYRSQFNSILANQSFDSLLDKLRKKVAQRRS